LLISVRMVFYGIAFVILNECEESLSK
jgi:hypothetical protein